jgi:hypothetical protein
VSLSKSECDVIAEAINLAFVTEYESGSSVDWTEEIDRSARGFPHHLPDGPLNSAEIRVEARRQTVERLALVRKILCTGRCD